MKNHLFIALAGILFSSCNTTNERETRNLEKFDKVNVVGNVELRLERNSDHFVNVMANNSEDLANLITEVRSGELYVYYEKDCNYCEAPKYIIYLNHSGISDLTLTGKITLNSDDGISQKDLVINGDGILNGNLEVSVADLSVDLNGITNINISGNADTSNIRVTGIGMINTSSLKTKSGQNASNGIAFINE